MFKGWVTALPVISSGAEWVIIVDWSVPMTGPVKKNGAGPVRFISDLRSVLYFLLSVS